MKELFGIVKDVVKVAAAPVNIAAGVVRSVTKPIADAVDEASSEICEGLEKNRED